MLEGRRARGRDIERKSDLDCSRNSMHACIACLKTVLGDARVGLCPSRDLKSGSFARGNGEPDR